MVLSEKTSNLIVSASLKYLGRPYVYREFDCVHFVRGVYREVGMTIPLLVGEEFPPTGFHLNADEFAQTPLGGLVFFKRKASQSPRIWTHVAIIVSKDRLIHCSRHFGREVVVTSKTDFLEVYSLVSQCVSAPP